MRELRVALGSAELKLQVELHRALAAALNAVESGAAPTVALSALAERLAGFRDGTQEGTELWALAAALRSLDKASAWEPAVEAADANPSSYREAGRLIAHKALASERQGPWPPELVAALEILARLDDFLDVPRAASALRSVPLMVPVTNLRSSAPPRERPEPQPERVVQPTVLVHFLLDNQPVSWPVALQTGRFYRISATAVVDRWPEGIDRLDITWDSPVPDTVLERRGFAVAKGGQVEGEGYLIARAEIAPADSVELTPVVTYQDPGGRRYVAPVVGQRSLQVATFAPSLLGAGLPMVGLRVIELLNELDARIPSLPRPDRLNLLHLLEATTRFAALANEREDLRGINEREFQRKLKEALAMDPTIGRRIQEAPNLGGGTTDLVLERIVDELKVSRTNIDLDTARRFTGQPAQYASAGDCPVSVLTILDDSPKSEPPGLQGNYMGWAYPDVYGLATANVPSMVAVVIIPVGFPIPSAWSRTR